MTTLPRGWAVAPLGDLCLEVRNGISTKPSADGGLPILRISAVRPMKLDTSDVRFLPADHAGADAYKLRQGDLLFTRYNGNRELVGACARVGALDVDLTYPDKLIRVRINTNVALPAYVEAAASGSEARRFIDEKLKTSAGQVGISGGDLKTLPVMLAPLAEQQRVADKLDTVLARVDACRDRLARVAPLIKRFRQSVLAAATSGRLTTEWHAARGRSAVEWRVCATKEAGRIQLGRQRSPKFHGGSAMRPYLRVQNVFEDRLDLSDVMTMDFPGQDFERYRLYPGDILLNEGQSPEYLGRPAMYRGELPGACFTNTLIRFQAHEHVSAEFALLVFRHYMHSGRYLKEGTTTTNIAHLGAGRFGDVEFPLPPLDEQQEIARRAQTLFAFADRLEARLTRAKTAVDRLTPSLLAKAFRGELVPQDPADEPAAELLKRLAAQREAAPARPRRQRATA